MQRISLGLVRSVLFWPGLAGLRETRSDVMTELQAPGKSRCLNRFFLGAVIEWTWVHVVWCLVNKQHYDPRVRTSGSHHVSAENDAVFMQTRSEFVLFFLFLFISVFLFIPLFLFFFTRAYAGCSTLGKISTSQNTSYINQLYRVRDSLTGMAYKLLLSDVTE